MGGKTLLTTFSGGASMERSPGMSLRTRDLCGFHGSPPTRTQSPIKAAPGRNGGVKAVRASPNVKTPRASPGEGEARAIRRLEGAQPKVNRGREFQDTSIVSLLSSSWASARSYFRLYWFPFLILATMAGILCYSGLTFWELFSGGGEVPSRPAKRWRLKRR